MGMLPVSPGLAITLGLIAFLIVYVWQDLKQQGHASVCQAGAPPPKVEPPPGDDAPDEHDDVTHTPAETATHTAARVGGLEAMPEAVDDDLFTWEAGEEETEKFKGPSKERALQAANTKALDHSVMTSEPARGTRRLGMTNPLHQMFQKNDGAGVQFSESGVLFNGSEEHHAARVAQLQRS